MGHSGVLVVLMILIGTLHPIERGFNGLADYGTGNVNMARPKNENVTATWNAPGVEFLSLL